MTFVTCKILFYVIHFGSVLCSQSPWLCGLGWRSEWDNSCLNCVPCVFFFFLFGFRAFLCSLEHYIKQASNNGGFPIGFMVL